MVRGLGRCICRVVPACACIASFSLCLPALSSAGSEFSDDAAFSRRYSLIGSLELSYFRFGAQGMATTDDFRQVLTLEHRGFVLDPNFVAYSLSGVATHDLGKGVANTTLTSEDLGITLFHSLPDSWKKNADFIPHPVWLRFSHDADPFSESTSYGLSFTHSVEQKKQYLVVEKAAKAVGEDADLYEDAPSMTSKVVEKERAIPIPLTFFDYDHYNEKIEGNRDQKDVLSLRSSLKGKYYDYSFLFEHQNETAAYALNQNVVQLTPNYAFYDPETRQRININNVLRHEEINQGQSTELTSSTSLIRPIGKDSLSLTGMLAYVNASAAGETAANYAAVAAGSYTQQLSSSLTNSPQLSVSVTKSSNSVTSAGITQSGTVNTSTALTRNVTTVYNQYYVRCSDTVSADISRLFRGTASAYVGEGEQGPEYGASAAISTKSTITTSLGYSYSLSSTQAGGSYQAQQGSTEPQLQVSNGRIAQHNVTFNSSGPILYNLSFQAGANFTLSEVPVAGGTAREETGTLTGNLLWRLSKTSMSFGANYTQIKMTDPVTSTSSPTILYAPFSAGLPGTGISPGLAGTGIDPGLSGTGIASGLPGTSFAATGSTSSSTSLYATLTRTLPMRTLFNLFTTWTRSTNSGAMSNESTSIEIKPSLSWTRGLTTVNAEYTYTYSKSAGIGAANEYTYSGPVGPVGSARPMGSVIGASTSLFIRLVRKFSIN